MSTNTPTNWTDSHTCPFCETRLSSPGAGFVDHLSEDPACQNGFTVWRERVGGDLKGGWSG
jgi:hypothetical protein